MDKESATAIKTAEKVPEEALMSKGTMETTTTDPYMVSKEKSKVFISIPGPFKTARADSDTCVHRDELIDKQLSSLLDYIAWYGMEFMFFAFLLMLLYEDDIATVEWTAKGLFTVHTAVSVWFFVVFCQAASLVFKFLRKKSKKKCWEIQDKLDSGSDRARRDTLIRKHSITQMEFSFDIILYIVLMVFIGFGGWCFCYPNFHSVKLLAVAGIAVSVFLMLVVTVIFIFLVRHFMKNLQEIEYLIDSDFLD